MIRSLNALAVRNMGESRIRSILSVFIVMLGVAMMIATDSFGDSARAAMPGGDEGQNFGSFVVTTIDLLMSLVGMVILLAASFLIFNAFLMSVTQRRQQIGMLRSIGMTRRQIMHLVVVEGLTIGIIGTMLGLIAGPLLAQGLATILGKVGNGMFTVQGDIITTPASLLTAALLGISVTLFAVLVPAWNATKVSPLAALRPPGTGDTERSSRRRAVIALVIATILWIFLALNPPGKWVQSPQDVQLTGLFILIWLGCIVALLPTLIETTARFARRILSQKWKATGRLMADNLERERQRVILTILTMAIGLTMIIGMTGMTRFFFNKLTLEVMEARSQRTLYAILPFNMSDGLAAFTTTEMRIPQSLLDELSRDTEGLADVAPIRIAFIPELAAMFPDMYTYVMSPREIQMMGDFLFIFTEGDWETATPLMEEGCGILIAPMLASRYEVTIGNTLVVESPSGTLDCIVAGIGTTMGLASFISPNVADELGVDDALEAGIVPRIGVDDAAVKAILDEHLQRYPHLRVEEIGEVVDVMTAMTNGMTGSVNGILVIAVLAAALGVINTTMMSVQERRHELGLIRAIGATRSQVRNVVMGEAALMGFVGAVVGLVAGAGMTVIFVVTYGGNSVGLSDMPLWSTAFEMLRPTFITGLVGLLVTPLIAALAAWLPTRQILQGTAIETLNPTD